MTGWDGQNSSCEDRETIIEGIEAGDKISFQRLTLQARISLYVYIQPLDMHLLFTKRLPIAMRVSRRTIGNRVRYIVQHLPLRLMSLSHFTTISMGHSAIKSNKKFLVSMICIRLSSAIRDSL